MLPLLVALILYLTFMPVQPALSIADFQPSPDASFLPMAAEAKLVQSENEESPGGPILKDENRLGVEISSSAAIAVDWESGNILLAKNVDEVFSVASITKLMTALVILGEEPDWDSAVEVWGSDMRSGGVPYVIPGEHVRVSDLFNVSLVASGNGATAALARSTGLSHEEFVVRMNETALSLGMTNTHFAEPTGLSAANISSARDISLLMKHAFDHTAIRDAVLKKAYFFTAITGMRHTVYNTNELLDSFLNEPPYLLWGGKTGFIKEVGYCFGAASQDGNGNRVIAVVLGAASKADRFSEVKRLIFWSFDAFEWR